MSFINRVKKALGSNEKEDVKGENSNEIIDKSEPVESLKDDAKEQITQDLMDASENDDKRGEHAPNDNVKNFKYLDNLIHSGQEEISLDFDIALSDDEVSQYQNGIELNDVIIYINGNGHSIDAKGKARIFRLNGKMIVLRNITFKNGQSPYGGAIFISKSTYSIIERNCYFNGNNASVDGGAIFTQGKVVIQDCQFTNNSADEDGGAISNKGVLEVSYSKLIGNESNGQGGSICSTGTLKIFESQFKDNIYKNGDGSVYYSSHFIEKGAFFDDKNMGDNILARDSEIKTDRNFRYLDNLIKGGSKEIIFDSDIILNDDEFKEYQQGITIEENDIIIDGNGFSIDARKKAQIFKITGNNVVLKNITFKNASISGYHFDVADVNAIEDIMRNNVISGGAAIQNFGKTRIESSKFFNNDSHEIAGAILNVENAYLELKDCEFRDNHASEFAAIDNFSKLKMEDCHFENNISAERGGVMGSAGELEVINSKFIDNTTSENGGVIMNWGSIRIYDSMFCGNYTNGAGGTIFNQDGSVFVSNSKFENNFSSDGAAIFNFDTLNVENSKFVNNTSRTRGGAIFNYEVGKIEIKDCEFKRNDSYSYGSSIYNKNRIKIIDSIFEENNNDKDIIFNQSELEVFGSIFRKNNASSLIRNEDGSKTSANGGKAIDNSLKSASIFNLGEFSLDSFAFDNNHSNEPFSENICNEGRFYLSEVKVLNVNSEKTILNKGSLDVKTLTSSLKETICNKGEIIAMYREESHHSGKYPPK